MLRKLRSCEAVTRDQIEAELRESAERFNASTRDAEIFGVINNESVSDDERLAALVEIVAIERAKHGLAAS